MPSTNIVNGYTVYNIPLSSSDSDGSDSSQASLDTITPPRQSATTYPRGILQPPRRPASQVLERGCVVCSSTVDIGICHICQGAYICSDHLLSENREHKELCRSVQDAWEDLVYAQTRRFDGHFAYTQTVILWWKHRLAIEFSRMGTYRSVQKAVDLYYETSQKTCLQSRYFKERFLIPKELLRLGELEESYHYVKFWTRFAGLQQSLVDEQEYETPSDGTHIWERTLEPIVRRGGGTTLNCLLMVLMIKLTLWLNIKDMQSARVLGRKKGLARETINLIQLHIACPTILTNNEIYNDIRANRRLTKHTRKLNQEVIQLRDAIQTGNKFFWATLISRNHRQWAFYGCGSDQEREGEAPPTRFLRKRGTQDEATFAVYSNLGLLDGRMGKAVDFVLATRNLLSWSGASMFGPGKGWLKLRSTMYW